jgi:hypothetical protein
MDISLIGFRGNVRKAESKLLKLKSKVQTKTFTFEKVFYSTLKREALRIENESRNTRIILEQDAINNIVKLTVVGTDVDEVIKKIESIELCMENVPIDPEIFSKLEYELLKQNKIREHESEWNVGIYLNKENNTGIIKLQINYKFKLC